MRSQRGQLDLSNKTLAIEPLDADLCAVRFMAMACPCEVLFYKIEPGVARVLGLRVAQEAWRIERKFSRYREDSVVAWLLANRGKRVVLDDETAALIDFASHCHAISDGSFDITSGVLRRAWTFDGSERLPDQAKVSALLPLIGFERLEWQSPSLVLPLEMELDFGGIGKEYAVDRAYDSLTQHTAMPFLINFGGDLRANRPPDRGPWQVGIEQPDHEGVAHMLLSVAQGAIATSGDARRYVMSGGRRYGHILDPRTGWPVRDAPRSVTVAASSCTEAGLLATLAMLKGPAAEVFLQDQQVKHWVAR